MFDVMGGGSGASIMFKVMGGVSAMFKGDGRGRRQPCSSRWEGRRQPCSM